MKHVILAGCIALASPAWAEDWPVGTVQLTAAQIEALLGGNTTVGAWSGSAYRQYFDTSGATLYLSNGRPPERGRWRVNTETDEYESWWEQTDWVGYRIVMTNDGYAWINGAALEPFEVLEGDQLGG